jgi:hypothetical protein
LERGDARSTPFLVPQEGEKRLTLCRSGRRRFAGRFLTESLRLFVAIGFLVSGVCLPALDAQGSGAILGRISDQETGATISEALVSISGTNLRVLSGEHGWYVLSGIPAGMHEVTVGLLGYELIRDTIQVASGDALDMDFQLVSEPIPVDGLVVSAEAEPLRNLAHRRVVRREELERRQASTMSQLLQGLVPGVTQTVTSGDAGASARIRIRGVRSLRDSPPLFFVDGVRVASARTGGPPGTGAILTFLDNINPKDVERIEIVHAAEATMLFGTDGAGGAILIYTRR